MTKQLPSSAEETRKLGDRGGFALRWRGHRQLWNWNSGVVFDRAFLQSRIENQDHRRHWRRHRDFVSAYRGLAEMDE